MLSIWREESTLSNMQEFAMKKKKVFIFMWHNTKDGALYPKCADQETQNKTLPFQTSHWSLGVLMEWPTGILVGVNWTLKCKLCSKTLGSHRPVLLGVFKCAELKCQGRPPHPPVQPKGTYKCLPLKAFPS